MSRTSSLQISLMNQNHTNNQCTPTFKRLWNRDFTMLVIAEVMLCMSCYMAIPLLPQRLAVSHGISMECASATMIAFVVGICVSGFFSSWLIQRYRRNKVFCISALCLGLTIATMFVLTDRTAGFTVAIRDVEAIAIFLTCGFFFGNAKRVLSCTLLIDKTESCHRTEANYTAIWTSRLAIVAGPMAALALTNEARTSLIYTIAAVAVLLSMLLVLSVRFPFRAPEEGTRILSLDRFFMLRGWSTTIVVMLMAAALGLLIATKQDIEFYLFMISGFVISIMVLQYAVVRTGRYTSAVGNACILVAMAAMLSYHGWAEDTLCPILLGMGFGLTSSEQLYKLLDHCDHCQRSTAESTYFMASDGGLFLGIAYCWSPAHNEAMSDILIATLFILATMVCTAGTMAKKKHNIFHA